MKKKRDELVNGKKKGLVIIGTLFVFIIYLSLITFISAYSISSSQWTQPGANSFSYNYGTNVNLFPMWDESKCGAGQDFIIQVAPFGCTPSVIRSDLLEEQNVPVFCQLAATKINPMIDVNAIDSISFSGKYPAYVSGVGFHPAQAALKTSSTTLINTPILSNIGYAVIVLKQQKNESSMPEWVQGNLTARIRYNIQNAFGIGSASYSIPELTDEEWQNNFKQYQFWSGKGYLKVESIRTDSTGGDEALVSIYADQKNKITTLDLKKGVTSTKVYVPGYYCMASVNLKLDGLVNPSTKAVIDINGDVYEVSENQQFLENRCSIPKGGIVKTGLAQRVSINCRDDSSTKNFVLSINPKIRLSVGDVKKDYSIGDKLYVNSKGESVYLAYLKSSVKGVNGKEIDSTTKEGLKIYTYTISSSEDKLTSQELYDISKKVVSLGNSAGGRFAQISYGETPSPDKGNIQIVDFADAVDWSFGDTTDVNSNNEITTIDTDKEFKNYFESAMNDYKTILNKFSSEKETDNSLETFGETALLRAIELADKTSQKKTLIDLCSDFKNRYPNSNNYPIGMCESDYSNSNSEVGTNSIMVNGFVKTLSLVRISEPSEDDYSASVLVKDSSGKINSYTLVKNKIVELDSSSNEFVQLTDLTEEQATFNINLKNPKGATGANSYITGTKILKLNEANGFGSSYVISISDINLKKEAKISLTPNINNAGTEANFSFRIAIEKRAINLSPDQIKDRITALNKTINDWQRLSDNLGKVVKGFKAACIGTGTFLTVKNFVTNLGGKSIARQEVMRSSGGWMDFCKGEVEKKKYNSLDNCLLEHNSEIEADVDKVYSVIQSQGKIDDKTVASRATEIQTKVKDLVIENPNKPGEKITVSAGSDLYQTISQQGYKDGKVTLTQLKDIERLTTVLKSNPSDELKKTAQTELYSILKGIQTNANDYADLTQKINSLKSSVNGDLKVDVYSDKNKKEGIYYGAKTSTILGGIASGTSMQVISIDSTEYIATLKSLGKNQYSIENVYDIKGVQLSDEKKIEEIKKKYSSFKKYDATSYNNKFLSPEVKYFEVDPYKGLPAMVPFDLKNGWYVAMRQVVSGLGNIATYDASGKVSSFYLCNVGENGRAEFDSGVNDDICRNFNSATGELYGEFPGLDQSQTSSLVKKAVSSVQEASTQYKTGVTQVRINGNVIKVGNPATNIPDIQCQDFMSAKDCWILFNTCDPVVCPSSRCNMGGTYYVPDVIQSGIVGSIALCLPNFQGGKGVMVPVCLSGVKAGMDGMISIFKNYRDCLQYNLDTGETVGICDEIHSIYLCEFLWKQALPMINLGIPKILELAMGQGTSSGGGEYLGVQSAWQNAEKSVNYFTQYYASSSYKAFQARTTDDVGSDVCKVFVSARYPASGKFFDALLEPDVPAQYHAWFSESTFTTATVPAISSYKVFYHIYAGKDSGAYYQVYLKGPTGTSLYQSNPSVTIASGYIGKGNYASETRDFTAPSGYKQLCIRVNTQEECGFQKVTTSFAVDYMADQYVKEQASTTNVQSESECISGTASVYSLLNPNLQAGVDSAINPALYNSGIVRVCSTSNPALSTDVNANRNNTRWADVGKCDTTGKIRCWLDTQSVKEVVNSLSTEKEIIGEVTSSYLNKIMSEGNYMSVSNFSSGVDKINNMKSANDRVNYITPELIEKAFFNSQKASLYLLRGNAYSELAVVAYDKLKEIKIKIATTDFKKVVNISSTGIVESVPSKQCSELTKENDCKGYVKCQWVNNKCQDKPGAGDEETVTVEDRKDVSYDFKTRTRAEITSAILYAKDNSLGNRNCGCGNDCGSYAQMILDASTSYKIPDPLLLLSIMMQESSCNKNIGCNSEGYGGLMQTCCSLTCSSPEYYNDNWNDPRTNIYTGAKELSEKYNQFNSGKEFICIDDSKSEKYYGWEAAARGYIGWGCETSTNNYVEEVMNRYVELTQHTGVEDFSLYE